MSHVLHSLRTLARLILSNPYNYTWQLQGMGMLRTYIPGDARLHIWDQRYAFPDVSMIHDHAQWGLSSTIVSGTLVNQRYDESVGDNHLWSQIKAGVGGGVLTAAQPTNLSPLPEEWYRPGDTYNQRPHEIHQTLAMPGTVTVMQKFPVAGNDTARVFWPKGRVWVSAEPRPATKEEIEAITTYALKRL